METPEKASMEEDIGATEPPPPPYSEEPPHDDSAGHPQPPSLPINRRFPPVFCLYRDSRFGKRYVIGEHQSQPLYAVTLHSGFSGKADIILHNGATDSLPPSATASDNKSYTKAEIALPPLPGSSVQSAKEFMEHSKQAGYGIETFSVEVGTGGARETFEWRHTSGTEVKELKARSSQNGWKLVRESKAEEVMGSASRSHGISSDGREVVAVWAHSNLSMTKVMKFQFLGSGADGSLGDRWTVMAVITALKMWDREWKINAAAGSAA